METKITHLRNLMTPVVNFFKLQEDLTFNEYDTIKEDALLNILKDECIRAMNNIAEIRQIIYEIPDDAIKS